jgi:hypothetical protein
VLVVVIDIPKSGVSFKVDEGSSAQGIEAEKQVSDRKPA